VAESGHPAGELVTVLAEISGSSAEGVKPEAVMLAAAQATARLLGVQEACVWVYEAAVGVLRLGARVPEVDPGGDVSLPGKDSICGQVLRSRRPFLAHRLTEHTLWKPRLPYLEHPQSGLFVPFFDRGRPLGVLVALSARERAFDDEDVRLVQALAAQVTIAIQNARLYEDARLRARQLTTILDVNKRLALRPNLEEMLSRITEEATRLLGVEAAGLRLVEGDELVRAASFGPAAAIMVRERLRLGESLSGRVAKENRAIVSTNLADDSRHTPIHRSQARVYGIRAWLGVPLRGPERVVGVLFVIDRGRRRFEQADIRLLEAFADQAAIAIENARLYEELAERERRLHELIGRLLVAQEEERRRVAYDVHDGLAQVAAAAQQHLEGFAARHRPRSTEGREALERARELAQRTVGEARRVITGLRPKALDDFGLALALRTDVEALSRDGWQITYVENLDSERLPPAIETALFRVAQEALTNVRKHAETTRVHLALRRRGGTVCLEIRDWGRGFQPSAVLAGSGTNERVGLAGMRERVAWLGGRCTVRSRPGAGTRIVVEVPLPTPNGGPCKDRSP